MQPDDSLQKSVRDWVEKTGFPLELRLGRLLRRRGWTPHHARFYIDHDEGKGREIDIVGWKFFRYGAEETSDASDVTPVYNLVIECKKSEKPWVIFTAPSRGSLGQPLRNYAVNPNVDDLLAPHVEQAFLRALSSIPFREAARTGIAVAEALGSQDNRPFGALLAATKAAHFIRGKEAEEAEVFLAHYVPVVVLDGALFETTLTQNGIETQRVDGILCRLNYESPHYKPSIFETIPPVYVCTEEGFGGFLSQCDQSIQKYWGNAGREEVEWMTRHARAWEPDADLQERR